MTHYAALIDKAADGSFGVTFPDAPGCTSAGATLEEAAANAVAALRDWIEVLEGKGTPLAAPRSLDAITADPEVKADLSAGAILVAVPVVARRGRTVRVQVTMDEGTLAAIDAAAARSGETRSGFLARSALDAMLVPPEVFNHSEQRILVMSLVEMFQEASADLDAGTAKQSQHPFRMARVILRSLEVRSINPSHRKIYERAADLIDVVSAIYGRKSSLVAKQCQRMVEELIEVHGNIEV